MIDKKVLFICVLLLCHVISFQQSKINKNKITENGKASLIQDFQKVLFLNVSKKFDTSANNNSTADFEETLDISKNSNVPVDKSEELDTWQDNSLNDFINEEEVAEMRTIVSSIQDIELYDGVYHPFPGGNNGPHRRQKRTINNVATHLNSIVTNLDMMLKSNNEDDKKAYLNNATSNLDQYIRDVQAAAKSGQNSTIQIMTLENVLLVQCGGWLWYPLSRVNKTITCSDGVMRFEGREKTVARACNLFNCMDVAM